MRNIICYLVLSALVIVPFILFGDMLSAYIDGLLIACEANLFYVALVLFAVLALDVVLPVPSCLLSTMSGVFLGPIYGFLVSFFAMCVSSILGYFLGRFFSSIGHKLLGKDSEQLEQYHLTSRPVFLFLLRPVPVLAEASSVYAGIKRIPFLPSFFYLTLGNAVISAVYAILGHWGRLTDSFLPAFATVIILSALGFLFLRFKKHH